MPVTLRPMNASEVSAFIATSRNAYLAERIASGDDAEAAALAVDEMSRTTFPDGETSPGHFLFALEVDGEPVGSLWLGPASGDRPGEWWVWDIVIDEANRGRGVGREAMLLAEGEARSHGAIRLGLSVFGHNTVARHLYERLGYRAVAIRMSKDL
jgi:ribosomal protein S18 acetylase RimI-like enzyme